MPGKRAWPWWVMVMRGIVGEIMGREVAPCLPSWLEELPAPATANLPGSGSRARGRRRSVALLPVAPRGRDLAKLPPSKATPETETSSRVWCMFFHYACASSRKEDDTQYTYIFNVPKLHGTNSSLISGMSFCG